MQEVVAEPGQVWAGSGRWRRLDEEPSGDGRVGGVGKLVDGGAAGHREDGESNSRPLLRRGSAPGSARAGVWRASG